MEREILSAKAGDYTFYILLEGGVADNSLLTCVSCGWVHFKSDSPSESTKCFSCGKSTFRPTTKKEREKVYGSTIQGVRVNL